MTKFEPGKTYYTRSICDWDTIHRETIASRTDKTITTAKGKRFRVFEWDGVEHFRPHGNYSMCAVIGADKPE